MGNRIRVDFSEHGRVFLPIHFMTIDSPVMEAVRMKVDTGADFTTLSKEVLFSLGYDYDWIKKHAITGKQYDISTAAGDVETVGLVQMPLINILGYEAKNWPFRVIMGEDRNFRNLLGRDLLAGFDYYFLNSKNSFEICRIDTFEPIYEFLPGQGINEISKDFLHIFHGDIC